MSLRTTGVFPVGGYQGGHNPLYRIVILFERHIWEDQHILFGFLMIIAAMAHIFIHWNWIMSMGKRIFNEIINHEMHFNYRSRMNLLINAFVGLGFFLAAISGIYLFYVPGGRNAIPDSQIIFTRTTWDLIHTWSGILVTNAAVIHFAIHWKWFTKVTQKIFKSLLPISGNASSINSEDTKLVETIR